jgi:hypothetical protein
VDGCAGVVVVADSCGQSQNALQDADDHSAGGVGAVAFEVDLGFEGLVDRLDGLAQGLEQVRADPSAVRQRITRLSACTDHTSNARTSRAESAICRVSPFVRTRAVLTFRDTLCFV